METNPDHVNNDEDTVNKLDTEDNDSNSSDVFMPTSLCSAKPPTNDIDKNSDICKDNADDLIEPVCEDNEENSKEFVCKHNEDNSKEIEKLETENSENITEGTTIDDKTTKLHKTSIALSICNELSIKLEPVDYNNHSVPNFNREESSSTDRQDCSDTSFDNQEKINETANKCCIESTVEDSSGVEQSENHETENILEKDPLQEENEEHNLSDDFKIGLESESFEEKIDPSIAKATYENVENNIYLIDKKKSRSSKEVRRMRCECPFEPDDPCFIGCGESCLNRLLMIECNKCCPTGDFCTNKNFQMGCQYDLEIFHAGRKGWGLKTNENISKGSFVIEYCGEVVDYNEFHNRTLTYASEGIPHYYFMTLKTNEIIDATKKGCKSRFINHSCNPNCVTQKWTVNGFLRVGFFALQHIKAGEELSFDYQFQRYGEKPQECFCASEDCRGVIGSEQSNNSLPSYLDKIMTGSTIASSKKRGRKEQIKEFYESELAQELDELLGKKWELKNHDQTLELIRLMVKIETLHERQELLKILQSSSDQSLLKAFVKYKGLSLLWSWMVDAPDEKHKYKREIIRTLKHIPIPNKNELDDSKILNIMTKWATPPSPLETKSDEASGEENHSGSDNELKIDEGGSTSQDESSKEDNGEENSKKKKKTPEHETSEDGDTQDENSNLSQKKQKKKTKKKKENLQKRHERREEIAFLSASLIDDWKDLKEVFKIPKKSQTPDRRPSKADQTEADSPTSTGNNGKSDEASASSSLTSKHESPDSTIKKQQQDDITTIPKGVGAYTNLAQEMSNNTTSYPDSSTDSHNRWNKRKYESRDWRKSPDHNNRYSNRGDNDRRFNNRHNDFDNNRRGRNNDWNRHRRYNNNDDNRYNRNNYRDSNYRDNNYRDNNYRDNYDRGNTNYDDTILHRQNDKINNSEPDISLGRNRPGNENNNWTKRDVQPQQQENENRNNNWNNWHPSGGPNHFQHGYRPPQMIPGINPMGGPVGQPIVPPLLPPPQPPMFPGNQGVMPPVPGNALNPQNLMFQNQSSSSSNILPQQHHQMLLPLPDQQQYNPSPSQQSFNPSPVTSINNSVSPATSFPNQNQYQNSPNQSTVSAFNVVNQLQLLLTAERLKNVSGSSAPNTPDVSMTISKPNSPKPPSSRASPQSKPVTLPAHWKTATDAEGRMYYYHALTRETSWDPPVGIPSKEQEEDRKPKKRRASDTPTSPPAKFSPRRIKQSPRIAAADTTHHQGPKTPPLTSSKSKSDVQKIKDNFKAKISSVVVNCLNAYQKVDCKQGRIKTQDDFKFLARKLTHGLIIKEIQRIKNEELLNCNDSVKMKVKEYIRNYMRKFGPYYIRS